MNYSLEAFEALISEVERQGGATLPEEHKPQDVLFKSPPYKLPKLYKKFSSGCGHAARMHIRYVGDDPDKPLIATVCAVCDNVGVMPRFIEAVQNADPELMPETEEDDDVHPEEH